MKLLVLGVSALFRRRVLPSLRGAGFTALDVCSRSGIACRPPEGTAVSVFRSYRQALDESDAPAVYVSTHNALHAPLVMDALARGRHVVVDKPAFSSLDQARAALELAEAQNLVLAEATVWDFHPRVRAAQDLVQRHGGARRLAAVFSFPPLPPGNYRLDGRLGGGALLDLAAYAASPGRIFFDAPPESADCRILSRTPGDAGVETAFACRLDYPDGRCLTGLFGFDTGYANTLQVLAPTASAFLDRAFTPPPGQVLRLETNGPDGPRGLEFDPSDTFRAFFASFAEAIRERDGRTFARRLLADVQVLDMLRAASDLEPFAPPAPSTRRAADGPPRNPA